MKDPYKVLGLEPTATAAEIKAAYRRLASLYHPDKHPAEKRKEMNRKMAEVNKAFDTLADKRKREKYDAGRTERPAGADKKKNEGKNPNEAWADFMRKARAGKETKAKTEKPKAEKPKPPDLKDINYSRVVRQHFCGLCAGRGKLLVSAGYKTQTLVCHHCQGAGIQPAFLKMYL